MKTERPGLTQAALRRLARRITTRLAPLLLRVRPWCTNPVGRRLYLVPHDERAQKLLRSGGVVDGHAVRAWNDLVDLLSPDLIVDVGANYGEVILGVRSYPEHAELHAVEANPSIAERLRRSIAESDLAVRLHEEAASSEAGVATLYLNATSSGLSSLATVRGGQRQRHRGGREATSRHDDL